MRLGDQYRKITMAVAALVLAATLAPAAAGADATVDPLPFAAARAMEVDPGTGRVFVSGGDQVEVYAPDGSRLATVPGVAGAWGMDAAQGSIWVNATTPDQIVRINPSTLAVTARYTVNQPLGDDLTILGGSAWFGAEAGASEHVPWGRLDLATSTYEQAGTTWQPSTGRLGTSTSHLLLWDRGVTAGSVYRVPTGAPFAAVATGTVRGFGQEVVSNDAGTKVWTSGGPWIEEYDAATLASTGVKYRGTGSAGPVAWSPAHGGMLASGSTTSINVFTTGNPTPLAEIPVEGASLALGMRLAADGDTAYLLVNRTGGGSSLRVVDLRPAVNERSPAVVVAGAPTEVTVSGRSLGGATSVTVGGKAVDLTHLGPGQVTFTTPSGLTAGTKSVVITGPTGTASTTLDVVASTGATLTGTVRIGTSPGSGVSLSLSGGTLGAPRSTTSASDGSYTFAGAPTGSGFTLTVHDPSAAAPDQVIRNLAVSPNATTTLDVDLSRPRADGSELADTDLGSAAVRDLLVDPTTGRIVVATGDEVDVLDAEGRLLTRIREMAGARALSRDGGSVYVGLTDAARIVRIDLATMAVTGSWPVGRPTTGDIAASGGKVWFVDGDDQWTRLRSLDPATGAVSAATAERYFVPQLRSVTGSSDRFLAGDFNETSLIDGASANGRRVFTTPNIWPSIPKPDPPLIADATTGVVYDKHGRRFRLRDLYPDGTQFPGSGSPARTTGRGGLVSIGGTVSRESSPVATHAFDGEWTATGLDAGGNRFYTTFGDQLVVHDLAPHIDATSPEPHYEGHTASIEGSGLGPATRVTVDGTPVAFEAAGPNRIDIELDGLAPGLHRVEVTTPWGASGAAPITVLAPRAPGAPAKPEAIVAPHHIEVVWTAVADDGGRPITGYEVTASPSGTTCTTTEALSCTFTALAPGSASTFTVRAINVIGSGPASPATAAIRMPTLPAAPSSVELTPGLRSINVAWTAPDDGGLPITGYLVCSSTDPTVPAGSTCRTVAVNGARVDDATAGVPRFVTVSAVNPVGAGARSAPKSATPFREPDAPTSVAVTPGRMSAQVSWTPAGDGGSPLTGTVVCAESASSPGSFCLDFDQTTPPVTMPYLRGGTTYRLTVSARNAGGTSPASAPVTATIPLSTPAAPPFVQVLSAYRGLAVAWFADEDGGSPVTSFLVCSSTVPSMAGASCTSAAGTARSLDLTDLEPGVERYVTVTAVNSLGPGPASSTSAGTAPYDIPGPPTAVTAVPGSSRAAVTWSAPADDGGNTVTGYEVTPYIGASAQPAQAFASSATAQQITDLTPGVAYTFEVRARNGGGLGVPSARSAPVTPTGTPVRGPFASWDAFVARQLTDFTGSAGTKASRSGSVAKLTAGTLLPSAFVQGLLTDPWFGPAVAPTTRLYWAYFGRIPDHGGLEYWAGKRRTGTTLIRISASFAGSGEFKRTYGSLSNAAFVDLVYRNVLGRPGDAAGRAYWIKRLGQGTSRGQVMVTFSESAEYVRATAGRVGVVQVVGAMLDRSPTTDEVATWATHPVRTLIDHVRLGTEYADHVG